MTHTLPLTNSDKVTLVDEDTYNTYKGVKFCLTSHGYALTTRHDTERPLHRLVMNPGTSHVDHINGNPLDNRRCNLRLCTHRQNQCNRGMNSNNTSGYKGVDKKNGRWRCQIRLNGKNTSSYHDTALEAAHEYNRLGRELHGEFFQGNDI